MKNKVFVIAEAGVNHNGSLSRALRLVDAAAASGADAVKFQTFRAESLVCRNAPKAEYQLKTTNRRETQFEMIRRLELTESDHRKLFARCRKRGIAFMSSPFDCESARLLYRLGLRVFKIPSGEITSVPLLRTVGAFGARVILSTGMATLGETRKALGILTAAGTPKTRITVLQCTTEYPAPYEDVNLLAMKKMGRTLGVATGYSDHTCGITVAIAAAALGAEIIEKHFTLDRRLPGPDHKASIEPDELKALIEAVRVVGAALGTGNKTIMASERKNCRIARKSIVAAAQINAGDTFNDRTITLKRPEGGLSPWLWDRVIGKKARRSFAKDERITL